MTTPSIDSKIAAYIKSNPEYKEYSREKVVSIMLEKGALTRQEAQSWYRQMEERLNQKDTNANRPSQMPQAAPSSKKTTATSSNIFTGSAGGTSKIICTSPIDDIPDEIFSLFLHNNNTPEKPGTQAQSPQTSQVFNLTDDQAQNEIINTIMGDVTNSYVLYQQQDNGVVSKGYDALKTFFDADLSSSNVEEALALQAAGAENLLQARDGAISKREYYLQNKEHLKKMLTRRLYDKDENSGLDFIDRNRGDVTREEFGEFLEDYIQTMIDRIPDMDSLKNVMHGLVTSTPEETEANLQKILENAKKDQTPKFMPDGPVINIKSRGIPIEFDTDEAISFEEVFKYERGTEYKKENVERMLTKQQDLSIATSAYNKYAQFKSTSDALIKSDESAEEKVDKLAVLYEKYYGDNISLAKEKIQAVISESKLMISAKEEEGKLKLDLSAYGTEEQKKNVVNLLLRFGSQAQEKQLEKVLGGKVEDKMLAVSQDYETSYNLAYGSEFTEELVQAMENDNKTFISKYTGELSMYGMGMTVLGSLLCFTPAAPFGAGLITLGNTLAIGGMAAESALGYTEALTREVVSEEELKELDKNLIMNAGGFVVGYGAGKLGMKAFNKLIDKKLAATFKTQITQGNRGAALKEIFSNPEKLANFMEAAGAKIGTDFIISYAGDLAMMGVLDTNDNWQSLLKANIIGIVVGTSSDIADIGKLSYRKDPKIPQAEPPKIDLSDEPLKPEAPPPEEVVPEQQSSRPPGSAIVSCVSCGVKYDVPVEFLGDSAECSECGELFTLAEDPEAVSDTTEVISAKAELDENENLVRFCRKKVGMLPNVKDRFSVAVVSTHSSLDIPREMIPPPPPKKKWWQFWK